MLETASIGRTGVEVTRLGFGGGPIGNLGRAIDDDRALAVVEAAHAAGIRYFDVAPLYGHGRSETRLGGALRRRPRGSFTLSTKVGRLLVPAGSADFDRHGYVDTPPLEVAFDYSAEGARRSLDASRERLGLERIDIVLVHDLDRRTHGTDQPVRLREALDGALPALLDLRDRGEIAAVGIGLNEWQAALDVARRMPIDVVLLAGRFTLLEQEPLDRFLPFCAERGIAVVVGGPYNSGILATGPIAGARFDYAPAPPGVLQRTRAIEAVLARHGVTLRNAALRFPLLHPAVAAVIPGVMTEAELTDTLSAYATPVPAAAWAELAAERLVRLPDRSLSG